MRKTGMTGVIKLCIMILMGLNLTHEPSADAAATKADSSWETEWHKSIDMAKREGKVVIYSTPSGDVIRSLAGSFERKHGIKVDFVNGRGEELTQRMQVEKTAGIKAVDVIMSGGPTTQMLMKPLGLLGRIDSILILPEVLDPQAWITKGLPYLDKDRTGMAMAASFIRYVLRNTAMVRENEITSYKDLLNPKWKGKIVTNDPTVSGTASGFLTLLALDSFGIEETKDFMRRFVQQQPAITRDRRLQVEWVARGKYALSVASNVENVVEFINIGAPVALVKVKEGGFLSPGGGGLAVPLTPAHPYASKVFVNWLMSKEGHNVFVKAYGSPGTRRDSPREGISPQFFADPGERFYEDNEEAILYRDKMTKLAKEIFAPLMKN